MNNKGQLTVFIIVGLIILVGITISVYYLQYQPTPPLVQVDIDILPIYNAVTLCAQELATQGINRMGLQGGYLEIPPAIKNNPSARIALTPTGSFSVPYWYYEGEDRTPSIDNMQKELALFVQNNLKDCVDFSLLKDFTVQELGEITAMAFIAEQNVVVDINWPLRIKTQIKNYDQNNYRVELPVRLKKMYELASRIMQTENKKQLLENATIELISANPEIPLDGLEFTCETKKWQLKEVENKVKQMLNYNLPNIRIKNTNYLDFQTEEKTYYDLQQANEQITKELESLTTYNANNPLEKIKKPKMIAPDDAFDYNQLTFNVDTPTTDLQVGFSFNPNQNILFNAQPNDGGLMKSNQLKGDSKYLKFMCMNQYHFTYTIIYPVTARIRDPDAFDGQGFTLQFAFPVLISNNKGNRETFNLKRFVSPYFDSEYCDKKSDRTIEFIARGFEEDLPISTELNDAEIEFICGPKLCPLGKTKSQQGNYKLRTQIPQGCGNPLIKASKEGYLPEQKILLTGKDKLEFELTQLRQLNIDVLKYELNKYSKQLGQPSMLSPREELIIHVSSPDHKDFNQYLIYPKDTILQLMGKDATYTIEMYLRIKDLGTTLGGKRLENIKINYPEFANKDTIVLKTIEYTPLPTTDQETAEMYDLIYTEQYNKELRPEFK